jgi:hypothetical protein
MINGRNRLFLTVYENSLNGFDNKLSVFDNKSFVFDNKSWIIDNKTSIFDNILPNLLSKTTPHPKTMLLTGHHPSKWSKSHQTSEFSAENNRKNKKNDKKSNRTPHHNSAPSPEQGCTHPPKTFTMVKC